MLAKLQRFFTIDHSSRIGIERATRILNSDQLGLQSFILCANRDKSHLKEAIATAEAIATIFNKKQFMININLDYVNSAKWCIDNIYNQIDKIKNDFSIIYFESTNLDFLQNEDTMKQIIYLAKTIRKFEMKLILLLPIYDQGDLKELQNFSENFIFINF